MKFSFFVHLYYSEFLKIDFKHEVKILKNIYPLDEKLSSKTIQITNKSIVGIQLRDLIKRYNWNVTFSRLNRKIHTELISWGTTFQIDDYIRVVGNDEEIDSVAGVFGKIVNSPDIMYDKSNYDSRRIFISNPDIAGKSIASLNIQGKYNAVITRIRRGDIDMVAHPHTVLEMGDRIRFIARKEELDELSNLFGDSYHESSKVNLFSFGLGLALGLILGSIEFSLSPTTEFKLGYAGGPLIVGLILGSLRRTGPIVWTLPFSVNVTLQQIGLIFLLSTIGVSSGGAFVQSLSMEGLTIFIASAVISLFTAFIIIWVGYKYIKLPFSLLMGMVSNQPAILDFALTKARNRIPQYGFAMMFPVALILKILIAQILFFAVN